ncbi:MAG TPA: MBL fold metallo-hydrolase [Lentimicrobium sp.]|nr:MBL fold metallo-hydrolase [Lentimicrobium sp.]
MPATLFPHNFEFCTLASGSSGNCHYFGSEEEGILVDAGISARRIRKSLDEIGAGIGRIKGIFITHDHIDHIGALTRLTRHHKIPVYCTEGTWKGILRNRATFDVDQSMYREIKPFKRYLAGGFAVEAFPTSHDAHGSVGYHISNNIKSITVATDLGYICDNAAKYLKQCDAMFIESNYDEHMLLFGSYPAHLKERIHGPTGHLCNSHTAQFLAENYRKNISHIVLGHLSAENNTPSKALETLHEAFTNKGITLNGTIVKALARGERSELYYLD